MDVFTDHTLRTGARLRPPGPGGATPAAALPASADVAIIGAGVIGLSIGWRLARRGVRVVVLDRGEAGAGTTLSATGMLAASAEHEPGGDALLPFALESQRLWPVFREELESDSGVALDYRSEGVLVVALSRDEVERLRARHRFLARSGLEARWIDGPELRALEPSLRASAAAAIACPHDHQVDPRRLVAALRAAFTRAGGTLVERCAATGLLHAAGRIAGVETAHGACRAPQVVLATGVWAGEPGLLPSGARLPLRPVKGQALALRARAGSGPLRHTVWTDHVHLAPKADGQLIVGATMEEAGFDDAVTAGGVFALLEGARRALPSVEEMALEAVWTGFRPTSDDDAPILGDLPGAPGLTLAVGHHRNGILLAPATAHAIDRLLDGREMGAAAEAMNIARFDAP